MAVASNLLSLTIKNADGTTTPVEISVGDIISIVVNSSDATDSDIKYVDNHRKIKNITVNETTTAIKALDGDLIDLTLTSDSSTITVNAEKVKNVWVSGSGSKVKYDEEGAAWNYLTVTQTPTQVQALVNTASSITAPVGTAGTDVTAVETGNGKDIITTLTFNSAELTIAGAAAEAVGHLAYTFPAGVHFHEVTDMNINLQGGGTVDADTPDVGVGSVIGTGAVSVLSGTATFEDYITGQTATDVSGTAIPATTVATAGALTGISINTASDVKTLHLNVADTWAGADTITVTGTIVVKWSVLR